MKNLKWLKSSQDATLEGKKVGNSEGNEKCHCEEGECPTWQSRINVLGNSKKSKIKKLNTLQPSKEAAKSSHAPSLDGEGWDGVILNQNSEPLQSPKSDNSLPSCPPALQPSKKAAFTLAEVLVTLGVIGVVAAMTLPTVIKNYHKKAWVAQLQKSYSGIEQAFQKLLADEEVSKLSDTSVWASKGNTYCGYPDSGTSYITDPNCKNFVTNLSKYLKIIGVEKYGNKENYLGNVNHEDSENYNTFVLSDGTMIMFTAYSTPITSSTDVCNQIKSLGGNMCSWAGDTYIDVNGRRGPNTWGRDIFQFGYSDEGKLYPYYGKDFALNARQNALENNNQYWRTKSNRCGTPDSGVIRSNVYGDGCAARIMENGWKMDY